jgi:hypothetical protein
MADRSKQHELAPETFSQISDLVTRYWSWVDGCEPGEVPNLYSEDGVIQFGDFSVIGKTAIRAFFDSRNSQIPPRITRHLSSSLRVYPLASGRVLVKSVVTVYAAIGAKLPLTATLPTSVLDFEDICHLTKQGTWIFERRAGTVIFIGPGAAPFLINQLDDDHPLKKASS